MTEDDSEFAEKRDFIRMFINAPIDIAITGTDEWFQGKGNDLSGSGISFTTDHELNEGDSIDVKLHPITPVTPPLEAIVSVIRCNNDDSEGFSISTKIEKILS